MMQKCKEIFFGGGRGTPHFGLNIRKILARVKQVCEFSHIFFLFDHSPYVETTYYLWAGTDKMSHSTDW